MKDFPAAYQSTAGSALDVDKAFYRRIAEETAGRRLVESFVIPIRTGRAWKVPAGHVFRIVAVEGPQVGDLNLWNLDNPRERLWASRTRQLQAAHVTVFDRLWSTLPYLRPMATITSDSLAGYGVDEYGGRIHDLLGTRCDPYVNRMLTGDDFDYCCHSNLVRAVAPHGLTELDVHDVLNVFQCTGLNDEDRYFMKTWNGKTWDAIARTRPERSNRSATPAMVCRASSTRLRKRCTSAVVRSIRAKSTFYARYRPVPAAIFRCRYGGPTRATRWRSAGRSGSRSTRSTKPC